MPLITCPHCGAERNTPADKLPQTKAIARCPECRQSFPFQRQQQAKPGRTARCPHCGLERSLPSDRLSIQATNTVTCRRCQRSFGLQPSTTTENHAGLRSIGQLLTDSWELFCRRGWGLLALYLLGGLLVFTPLIAATLISPNLFLSQHQWRWPALLLAAVYSLLGLSWMTAGMFIYLCRPQSSLFNAASNGLRQIGPFALLLILLCFVITGSSLLLFIPGLLFCVWFFFCQYVLADEGIRGLKALEKSRRLASGHWWAISGRAALLIVFALAVAFLTARLPYVGNTANLAFALLLTPFSLVYFYLIYSDLKASYRGPRQFSAKAISLPLIISLFGWLLIPGLIVANSARQNLLSEDLLQGHRSNLVELHNDDATLQQTQEPVLQSPAIPQQLSHNDYDRLLATQQSATTGDELKLGPATLFADQFWPDEQNPHLWLRLQLSDFPNLNLAQKGAARILIDKVLDATDHDRYNRQHSFEHPAFHWIPLADNTESSDRAGIRNVYLQQGTRPEQIRTIRGKLELNLPLGIESLRLTRNDIGKTLKIAGKKLVLQKLDSNAISLRFLGERAELLNVRASDSNADPLREVGFTWQQVDDAFNLQQMFDGNIDSITVLVASDSMVRHFPFELTR